MHAGRTTASDGVELAWDRRGEGSPVILVHGITDNRRSLDPIADRIDTDHEVVCLDLRGHGESGRGGSYAMDRFAADLAEVVADLGLASPAIVGHSLGGLVATAAAPFAGARAVVNIDQPLVLGELGAAMVAVADGLRDPATFHVTLAGFFEAFESPGLDPATAESFATGLAAAEQEVVLGVWGPMLDGPDPAVDELVDAVLAGVTMPYLAIHGMDPGPGYPGWLRERVPHAEVEVHPGAGHFLHLVDPDAFVDRIRGFIA